MQRALKQDDGSKGLSPAQSQQLMPSTEKPVAPSAQKTSKLNFNAPKFFFNGSLSTASSSNPGLLTTNITNVKSVSTTISPSNNKDVPPQSVPLEQKHSESSWDWRKIMGDLWRGESLDLVIEKISPNNLSAFLQGLAFFLIENYPCDFNLVPRLAIMREIEEKEQAIFVAIINKLHSLDIPIADIVNDGKTLLHASVAKLKYLLVEVLISHYSSIDIGDKNHHTPLMYAEEAARLLDRKTKFLLYDTYLESNCFFIFKALREKQSKTHSVTNTSIVNNTPQSSAISTYHRATLRLDAARMAPAKNSLPTISSCSAPTAEIKELKKLNRLEAIQELNTATKIDALKKLKESNESIKKTKANIKKLKAKVIKFTNSENPYEDTSNCSKGFVFNKPLSDIFERIVFLCEKIKNKQTKEDKDMEIENNKKLTDFYLQLFILYQTVNYRTDADLGNIRQLLNLSYVLNSPWCLILKEFLYTQSNLSPRFYSSLDKEIEEIERECADVSWIRSICFFEEKWPLYQEEKKLQKQRNIGLYRPCGFKR